MYSLTLFQSLTVGYAKPELSLLNQCSNFDKGISVHSANFFALVLFFKKETKVDCFGKFSLTSINLFPLLACKPCLFADSVA